MVHAGYMWLLNFAAAVAVTCMDALCVAGNRGRRHSSARVAAVRP